MHEPGVIAAMAQASVNQGSVAVRIESPAHVKAVRQRVSAPIIGLWKRQIENFEVYITPQFEDAVAIAQAGADIIAIDATLRSRPGNDTMAALVERIHAELGKPVMADVDALESAIAAVQAGADIIGTTLYGYTGETKHLKPPGFDLLTQLVQKLDTFIICEGGISSAAAARQAMDLGANAVVVGTAITGVDLQVQAYHSALKSPVPAPTRSTQLRDYHLAIFDTPYLPYREQLIGHLTRTNHQHPEAGKFFDPISVQSTPLGLYLFDAEGTMCAGLAGYSQWHWLNVEFLWIAESLRYQGYGSKLMQQAEAIAQQRGCQYVKVETFDFQARGFYAKLGYQLVAQLNNLPPGFIKYQLVKSL